MARRRREKRRNAEPSSAPRATARDHMARVHVTDEVWAEFRAAAGHRPVNVVLGRLVEREVARERSRRLKESELDDRELLHALERARELHADLQAIVTRIESRVGLPARPPQAG